MSDLLRENRVKALFNEALDLDEQSRAALLDRAAADDPSVQIEVRVLINAHERAGDFLVEPAAPATPALPAGEKPGDTIGRYKLLQLIGEGGFGRVYMAEQREPVIRRVALKIIKAGMDTQQVIARFEAERQALALMDHRNIATVYDAGATHGGAGRPYFVMELVRGVPITQYCDEHVLTIEQRLELFREVCSAVQHAHTKGIIHRDIKPSNVMVTLQDDRPVTKIIDFGIAKATSARLTEKTLFTEFRQLIGTPEYMSPEQADANSSDVDTRSDVYSLGVLMYELLTGATPFDGKRLRSAAFGELQRIIREEDPPKPSTRLSTLEALPSIAAQRALEPRRLTIHLRGDLDWITLKALDKSRERRYGSAADLAEDVRRHLSDEPVLAGPPGVRYRAKKFMRRHRVGVLAASVVALAVVAGAIGTTIGMLQARQSARRAQNSAEQASGINDFMREVLMSASPSSRGADVRLADVLHNASATAAQRFAGHPEVEAAVRDMLGRVFLSLDFVSESIAEFKQAATLAESMFGPDDRRTLEERLHHVQALLAAERYADLERILNDLAPRVERITEADDNLALHATRMVAAVHRHHGRLDQAERMLRETRQRSRDAGEHVMHINTCDELVGVLRRRLQKTVADGQPLDRAMFAEAQAIAREMMDAADALVGPEGLPTLHARTLLADLMLLDGDVAGAAAECRTILAVARNRLGDCHAARMFALSVMADTLHAQGDSAAAADLCLQEIDCLRRRDTTGVNLLSSMSDALPFLDRGRRWAEGEALAREFCERLRQIGGGHGDMLFNGEAYIARFMALQGRLDEAQTLIRALLPREGELEAERPRARLHLFYGSVLIQRGAYEDAEQHLHTAAEVLGDIRRGATTRNGDDLVLEFIALYEAWGKPDKAEEYRRLQQEMKK